MFDIEQSSKPRSRILKPPAKPLPSGCRECCGRPWVTVIANGIAYSQRCGCLKGQALKAKDEERRRR